MLWYFVFFLLLHYSLIVLNCAKHKNFIYRTNNNNNVDYDTEDKNYPISIDTVLSGMF